METINMTPTAFRAPINFTVTNANASVLLADFSRAAHAAGWSDTEIEEIAAHPIFRDDNYLQCTLAAHTAEYLTDD
jgi:hypothetical protein